jgi:hypothetical protein
VFLQKSASFSFNNIIKEKTIYIIFCYFTLLHLWTFQTPKGDYTAEDLYRLRAVAQSALAQPLQSALAQPLQSALAQPL